MKILNMIDESSVIKELDLRKSLDECLPVISPAIKLVWDAAEDNEQVLEFMSALAYFAKAQSLLTAKNMASNHWDLNKETFMTMWEVYDKAIDRQVEAYPDGWREV